MHIICANIVIYLFKYKHFTDLFGYANIVIYLFKYKHFTDLFGYTKKLLYICIIQIKLYK